MPLPDNATAWPPAQLANITPALAEWDAWWVGDPAGLETVYRNRSGATKVRPSQQAGGVTGALARFWWGRPTGNLTAPGPRKLHLPVAADLCQASADLLFADGPQVTSTDKATQDRLQAYLDDGLITQAAQAAEIGAALGSSYLRVAWDPMLQPMPFLSPVDADAAWPTFRYGRLVAVTFWWVVRTDGQQVWRHLERHELDGGDGVILHGLYQGTATSLGRVVPLTDHPATAGLADEVDDQGAIHTHSPGLAVVHVPNQQPSRRWRNDPVGRYLGRSDLDGIEPFMDALDETWTSWMRDIDNGKGRIIAAESVLDDLGPGMGAAFDTERQVFTPIRALASRIDGSGLPIEAVQFAIRVDEHQRTATEQLAVILRTAGYSAQTFGEGAPDSSVTATEVQSRDQRSMLTRDRKLRAWQPALTTIVTKLLAVDAQVFGARVDPADVSVKFSEGVQDTPLQLAQTASSLRTAQAASTKTLVKIVHPDWDDTEVDAETAAILAEEAGQTLADPAGTYPAAPSQP